VCGRYTLATPDPADIRARFAIDASVEVRRRYNVAPGDDVLAVTTDREGRHRGELLRWGLVPSWGHPADGRLKMINARAETVTQRPAFRGLFGRFRCLIVTDGFYEWQAMPGQSQTRVPKQAFHITSCAPAPFAFAGLWSAWHDDQGAAVRSCAILTVPANFVVAPLHDRMPVILSEAAEAAWLDRATPETQLRELLQPLAPEMTVVRAVGPVVNDARYDGPECLAPAAADAQVTLF
jgi:putative SOS response-associated peptidase YedK